MHNKGKFKAGLSFGIFMTVFFILSRVFTEDDLTAKRLMIIVFSACSGGIIAGLLFAWLTGWLAKSKFVSQATKIDTQPAETILFETPANHFKGMEAVGGMLYLTNQRLVFKSHKLNFQNHQLALSLSDITQVHRYKTLGLVNNGLAVKTNMGKSEKFVVEQVEEWVKLLTVQHELSV
ncbi:MAG: hypothetical protein JWQ27_2172 [Ferruginibacter sp.]|nr:hypothetical protein [Ferruginibacter sp.]